MLFNSVQFLVFFPVVSLGFFLLPQRLRWVLLLAASYYFYMAWRPEYLALILASTLVDYFAAIEMARSQDRGRRRRFLILSLTANLGLLFTFKYFNFVNGSLAEVASWLGRDWPLPYLDVLLPVGISFYTFQTLSYSIDVYKGIREPERHFGIFALYVAFFPQLVAGPIERSTRLLPQFRLAHRFDLDRLGSGLSQILLGFFKKVVIADRIALFVDAVYSDPGSFTGVPLIAATYLFAYQIYCDFSGYSDIALGTARILGFDLMDNFTQPYFARSIREFWQRWHISLSTWFRDYVYFSLGGNRVPPGRWFYNIVIVFVLSGIWHGAAWTFLWWGALHGAYYVASITTADLRQRLRTAVGLESRPGLHRTWSVLVTFHLVTFAWIFFRAESLSDALYVVTHWFRGLELNASYGTGFSRYNLIVAVASLVVLELIQLMQRRGNDMRTIPIPWTGLRWITYWVLFLSIVYFGVRTSKAFVYFQF